MRGRPAERSCCEDQRRQRTNLGRLGKRQPEVYGATTHDDLIELCVAAGKELGVEVIVRQSDHEAICSVGSTTRRTRGNR